MQITRRFLLGGAVAGLATPAWPEPPDTSPWPEQRPASVLVARSAQASEALIDAASLGGEVGFAVINLRTGQLLESRKPALAMPPASVAKTITTLYALDQLGPGHRFATRLIATGPLAGGRIEGDLVLAGGGDATLHTDHLATMAKDLRAAGVSGIAGRFLVWGGTLPYTREIAHDQPEYVGYNPAVSGLNLNFNRVFFEWKANGAGYELSVDARSEKVVPRVNMARVSVVARDVPVFTHDERDGREEWTVAASALGSGGGRWLPVRHPEIYAGDVFRTLARAQGITLPEPEQVARLPGGAVLVQHESEELSAMLRDMLRYSTNIIAEAVGMSASGKRGEAASLNGSARSMGGWLAGHGITGAHFADHSGLGVESRLGAGEMAAALVRLGPTAGLRAMLRPFAMPEVGGGANPVQVAAKTGTLNFVSTLAGYASTAGGGELAFAIFTGDEARRAAAGPVESPAGSRAWVGRARTLQQQLVARWAKIYGA
ncbi:MAG: D-alanyl-D-alanine carboxypeptidase/D-alanyl-D-alanine-endopeptidase [Phaeovulum sp.]|uniref:D-alanyl-D-alanine carboxypeptidase/D-alanyl-D-alanine endopeptidase n=1 Tax=Phaeovulum sp. TaxID=2934796 RepID=UPI00272F1149|nr:D-alanyl-D-alanine carboxypeptidase/D-alanyl-D-alanine-endopeptidase [Phaeovulum sp.]MDP2064329.1 D-alanyl-D-alanine carboxypeptidase/D-alanyl-D-alanine-endopeptidase [Phaeovulum sp.]